MSNASSSRMKVKGRVRYLRVGDVSGQEYPNNKNSLRSGHDHKSLNTLPVNEVVHDVRSHVGSAEIEVKELVIVAHRHRSLHV